METIQELEDASDSIRKIIDDCVGKVFGGIDTSDKCRETDYVWARMQTWALLLEHTNYGVTEMAKMYGNRNHATSIHGLKRHRDLIETNDPEYTDLWEWTTTLFNEAIKELEHEQHHKEQI